MGLTRFPHGVSSFGMPVVPDIDTVSYSGNTFFVDSAIGSDSIFQGTFEKPFATIDYAIGRCTANNGDVIFVKEGHVETVIAAGGLDLDVAGITIVFMGFGNNRGYITFTTAVTADMDVDAADVTVINPRFVAGIDALTGPIDVNAARFKMYNATWQDGTGINTTDCVVADANADDMIISNFEFIDGNGAGTQKQSFIQIAGATRPVLKNIICTGNFATGIIENGTAWIDAYLENVVLDNANIGPVVAILLQAASSGQAINCHLRVASGTTYMTADNDMQWFECYGTGTDATAGEKIGTSLATDIEAKIDVIDGYHDVPTADAATDAVIRDVVGRKTDTAVYVPGTTKSLSAYTKGTADLQERVAKKAAATMVNGQIMFTIAGGPIKIEALVSVCETANDATASTLQYNATPTTGAAQTISGASASLASAVAGASVALAGTALATAALLNANGPNLIANPGTIFCPIGTIDMVIGVGSTTGTWAHYLRYKPLAAGVTVS